MLELHGFWLELAITLPIIAAVMVGVIRDADWRLRVSSITLLGTLLCTLAAWFDFVGLGAFEAHDRFNYWEPWFGKDVLVIDELSAPLFSFVTALYLAVVVVTPRSKQIRFPFALTLASLTLLLLLISCREPSWFLVLLALQNALPVIELKLRGQVWQFFAVHQLLSLLLIGIGGGIVMVTENQSTFGGGGIGLIGLGLVIRCGCIPFHTWLIDLFDRASLGTAILFVVPLVGALGVVRLVFPIAPAEVLRAIALVSLATAVYAGGMLIVQTNTRRFFAYLVLGNISLVLIGLESVTSIGLTGGLSLWISSGISLVSLGIVIRAVEGRVGRISLARFHGLYGQMPALAGFFLLAVLSGIGFPGTVGFVGTELLVESSIHAYSYVGASVVLVMALNGIGALRAYFRIFTGSVAPASISMQPRSFEKLVIGLFCALMVLGGIFPQPNISSRYHAAQELLDRRIAPNISEHFDHSGGESDHLFEEHSDE